RRRSARMQARSLEGCDFDSVLLPHNFSLLADDGDRADAEIVLTMCEDRGVAVQTIKAVARRRWIDESAPHYAWYEPLPDGEALARAVRWVLARPRLFLNSSSDARILRPILEAASSGGAPPTDSEMEADVAALDIR